MIQKRRQRKVGQDKCKVIADMPLICSDETAAVEFFERCRWGDAPCCAHCGSVEVYQMKNAKTGERSKRFLWRCRDCKRQYTVRFGSVLEESRIPFRYWAYAFWRSTSSKKGVSALEIKRQTGLSYKSSLFLLHRIRAAFGPSDGGDRLVGTVEADETFVKARPIKGPKPPRKDGERRLVSDSHRPVAAAVDRGGRVRARVIANVTAENLRDFLTRNVDPSAHLMTDDYRPYRKIGRGFARHQFVRHSYGEYVGWHDRNVHTNSIESVFAVMKRGINGIYHNVSDKHLPAYVNEFAFRHNHRKDSDGERLVHAVKAAEGKRLSYQQYVV